MTLILPVIDLIRSGGWKLIDEERTKQSTNNLRPASKHGNLLLGPAVLGWIEPGELIQLLAEIGIFFLMFHAGIETQPLEFYQALKSLKDLKLANTRVARVIIASCVIDDLLTLVFFGLVIGVLSGGEFEPMDIFITIGKVLGFVAAAVLIGRFVYPRLTLPFRSEGGKGFTFILLMALAFGLLAEAIGLHIILGAYLAGLFFEDKVAHPNLVRIVKDRATDDSGNHRPDCQRRGHGFTMELDCPDTKAHTRAHDHFREELTALVENQGHMDSALQEALSLFLSKWLKLHVFGINKKFEAFVLESNVK